MLKIKSLGVIALGALSFTFMSFSSSSDDMYSVTYASNIENSNAERIEQAVFPTVAITAIARLEAVTLILDTRLDTRVDISGYLDFGSRVTTFTRGYANNVEKHSSDYAKEIEDLKDQQMRKLG